MICGVVLVITSEFNETKEPKYGNMPPFYQIHNQTGFPSDTENVMSYPSAHKMYILSSLIL